MLSLFIVFFSVQAEHVVLFSSHFNRSVPHFYFDKAVSELKEGDSIEFSNHKVFRLGKRLDSLAAASERGSRSIIFELIDYPEQVIRLPNSQIVQSSITQTLLGYKELQYLGPNIVELIDGLRHEYAIVEKLPEQHFTFLDFITNEKIPPLLQKKMLNAMLIFAKKTAKFSELGDFNLTQFVYDVHKDAWVLFDWIDEHLYFINDQKIQSPFFIWGGVFNMYLNAHSWDEEELNVELPKLTPGQIEKVNQLSKQITLTTEAERAKMLERIKSRKTQSCAMIMRELL